MGFEVFEEGFGVLGGGHYLDVYLKSQVLLSILSRNQRQLISRQRRTIIPAIILQLMLRYHKIVRLILISISQSLFRQSQSRFTFL